VAPKIKRDRVFFTNLWLLGITTATWCLFWLLRCPTSSNGGVSRDGKTITWKLKRNVLWHDGKPFTADDVVFTAAYAADPATSAYTKGSYSDVKVTKVDSHTVRVEYQKASPFWADPLVSAAGMIIPKHIFESFKGATSRDAPANLRPVGTGPYKFTDFKPR
jgi:peptide/nickel transport system substrate-binding protein